MVGVWLKEHDDPPFVMLAKRRDGGLNLRRMMGVGVVNHDSIGVTFALESPKRAGELLERRRCRREIHADATGRDRSRERVRDIMFTRDGQAKTSNQSIVSVDDEIGSPKIIRS